MNIKHFAAAGFPAVAIATSDEDRAIANVLAAFPERDVLKIACTGGLLDVRNDKLIDEQCEYPAAFARAASRVNQVIIVLDYQHSIKTPQMYRLLRDSLPRIKAVATDPANKKFASLLVLIAPTWKFPAEIEHDIAVISDSLPSRAELDTALQVCVEARPQSMTPNAELRNTLLNNACGLTLSEAENSFALASVNGKAFDAGIVSDQKMKLVRQSGLASILAPADSSEVGGLGELMRAIDTEIVPSVNNPLLVNAGLSAAGVIIDGIEGTGKTSSARALSSKLGWPIMRINMAELKASSGGIVGQSENALIRVLALARAVAPVIVLLDEAEKGFAGSRSNGDSGTSKGMEGIFLTEVQDIRDKQEKILFVLTTNDYSLLPRPIKRRMEFKFYCDIPSMPEREEVAAKKLAKYSPNSVSLARDIAELTEDWTPAEIEDMIRSAARMTELNITLESIRIASADVKPIVKADAEAIRKNREWGKANLRLANSQTIASKNKRSISTVD